MRLHGNHRPDSGRHPQQNGGRHLLEYPPPLPRSSMSPVTLLNPSTRSVAELAGEYAMRDSPSLIFLRSVRVISVHTCFSADDLQTLTSIANELISLNLFFDQTPLERLQREDEPEQAFCRCSNLRPASLYVFAASSRSSTANTTCSPAGAIVRRNTAPTRRSTTASIAEAGKAFGWRCSKQ